jgi:hypothetical protein
MVASENIMPPINKRLGMIMISIGSRYSPGWKGPEYCGSKNAIPISNPRIIPRKMIRFAMKLPKNLPPRY